MASAFSKSVHRLSNLDLIHAFPANCILFWQPTLRASFPNLLSTIIIDLIIQFSLFHNSDEANLSTECWERHVETTFPYFCTGPDGRNRVEVPVSWNTQAGVCCMGTNWTTLFFITCTKRQASWFLLQEYVSQNLKNHTTMQGSPMCGFEAKNGLISKKNTMRSFRRPTKPEDNNVFTP